ncbi:MAG: hypothetical protein NZ942_00775 [Candidatus Aenigmarchaeota archaeon]|nr:hypothetical protein [Candidatus Aenigmarchaeota archaeon]
MRTIKKVTIVFLIAGIICGIISNYFSKILNNLFFSLTFPFIVYFVLLPVFKRQMKIKLLIYNSFITFTLFWLVSWFTLYAL